LLQCGAEGVGNTSQSGRCDDSQKEKHNGGIQMNLGIAVNGEEATQ
jgi:hypothetical protein